MNEYFAIVVYRCLVAGKPECSLDVQVRYFAAHTEDEVRERLGAEEREGYRNNVDEAVEWELSQIMAVEEVTKLESGDEIVGFIADLDEFAKLV